MTWTATVLFGVLAAALAGSIAWQFVPVDERDEVQPSAPSQVLALVPGPAAPAGRPAELAASILARPLLSPGRRPPAAARAATPATELPRLTGIIISPDGSSAIFAGRPRALVVPEGGRVGEYTVRQIAPGLVTLNGPVGLVALRPSFDAARPGRATVGQPLVAVPGDTSTVGQDTPSTVPFERQTAPSGLDILRNLARPPASIR